MKKRSSSVLKKGTSKSKLYIEESFLELKQSNKMRIKIMEKLQKGLQFHTSGTQQLRSASEEIKLFAESIQKNEENNFLGSWYQKLGTFLKRYSDLHILLNNALTVNLLEPLQQFITKDVEEAMTSKKKFDRSHQVYQECKQKLENAKKKEKNPVKLQEKLISSLFIINFPFLFFKYYERKFNEETNEKTENEYTQLQAAKDLTKATLINQLKEISDTGYYSNLENVWDTVDSFAVFFKEGLTSVNKLSAEAIEDKKSLLEHKEMRTTLLNDKMEQFKEKYLKQLRDSQEKSSNLQRKGSEEVTSPLSPRISREASESSSSSLISELNLSPIGDRKEPGEGVLSPRRRRMKQSKTVSSLPEVEFQRSLEECTDPSRGLLLRIIYTETKYHNLLSTLVKNIVLNENDKKNFYEPFNLEFKDKYEERDLLFSNVLDIYNHQSSVVEELNKCKENWPEQKIIDALLKHVEGIRVYKPYLINYGTSSKLIEKATKVKQIQTFLNGCNNQTRLTFINLLESPTMALSTLKLQLELLMKNGECDSDHIESLENAFNLIQRVNEEIAIKKLNKVNLSKITLLQERLVNYEGRLDDNAERIIIHEASAILTTESTSSEIEGDSTKSKYYIVLCSDIILITKKSIKLITRENRVIRDKKFKVVHNFNILDATLIEQPENDLSFVLQVVGADEDITTHTIFLQSKDEKQIWLTKFNRQIEISNQKKLFGAPIEDVIKRENKIIPSIIDITLKSILENGGIESEGLIRVSGNARHIKDMRRCLDLGGRINVEKEDAHTVCGLLKLYLRCLPEPIMKTQTYDQLIEIVEKNNDENQLNERLNQFKNIIEKLPDVNKFSLQTICSFFELLAANSTMNKMHSRNIAIVMGPILLTNNEKVSWDLSKQNNAIEIVEQMIDHCSFLFSNIKEEKEVKIAEMTRNRRSSSVSDYSPDESNQSSEQKEGEKEGARVTINSTRLEETTEQSRRRRKSSKEGHRKSKIREREVVKEVPKEVLKDVLKESPKESSNDSPKGDIPPEEIEPSNI